MTDADSFASFAAAHGADVAAVRALLGWLRAQAGSDEFYIFWSPRGGGGRGAARTRTLVAFASPDTALAFAQRNQLSGASNQPRLRRLALVQLLGAVLGEPAIGALLLVREGDDLPAPGRMPAGVHITREEILARLRPHI